MPVVEPHPRRLPPDQPYLSVIGATEAIEFYCDVLGAEERMRLAGPDGKLGHAELEIGDSVIMFADEFPEMGGRSPKTLGGTPVTLMVYVEDVDAVFARALERGATEVRAVADPFYGDRSGIFEDPFGHRWNVATHIEDVSADEVRAPSGRPWLTGTWTVTMSVRLTTPSSGVGTNSLVVVPGRALGLAPPSRFGPFLVVEAANDVSLDFHEVDGPSGPSTSPFSFARTSSTRSSGASPAEGSTYWADPGRSRAGEINHGDGGRGVYSPIPTRHLLEIFTRPYGSGSA